MECFYEQVVVTRPDGAQPEDEQGLSQLVGEQILESGQGLLVGFALCQSSFKAA